ncbi:MAG: NUDIX domain-containing protein [Anaerolineales bacterium]|nr:NUDIX domain-containing protein [Anaerolineales bacterium]
MRSGAVLLLQDAAGRYALQLRDDRPDVAYARHWGLFGGWSEPGETPLQCLQREINEELGLTLLEAQLRYLRLYVDGDIGAHIFHCAALPDLGQAQLREGQR